VSLENRDEIWMRIHREEASLDASLLESIFEIFWKMEISRGVEPC
jgi:hypothetical protein